MCHKAKEYGELKPFNRVQTNELSLSLLGIRLEILDLMHV